MIPVRCSFCKGKLVKGKHEFVVKRSLMDVYAEMKKKQTDYSPGSVRLSFRIFANADQNFNL